MKDKLEHFIAENQDDFNNQSADFEKLWKGINLPATATEKRRSTKTTIFQFAAIFLIGIVSASLFFSIRQQHTQPATPQAVAANNPQPEVEELLIAETYYSAEIDSRLTELKKYDTEFHDLLPDILSELDELDSAYVNLKIALESDVNRQEIIELMIQNYRTRLKLIESILDQFKEAKKQNDITI